MPRSDEQIEARNARKTDLKGQLENCRNQNIRLKEWIKELEDENVALNGNLIEVQKKRSQMYITKIEEEFQGSKTELNNMSEECLDEFNTLKAEMQERNTD